MPESTINYCVVEQGVDLAVEAAATRATTRGGNRA